MSNPEKADTDRIRTEYYLTAMVVIWTIIVAASLAWNRYRGKQEVLSMARMQARVAYERDVIYRRWNAGHGGLYAPVTEKTFPNPYLKTPDRDVTTTSGVRLTLINPAYMTRQVHELAEKEFGVHGHITSLNPLRPENAPDEWEATALKSFERGEEEASSVEPIDGKAYLRLMRPLIAEQDCLECHASQGYQLGEVRGGLSVAVPMAPLWAIEKARLRALSKAHGMVWLVGMAGILLGTSRLKHQINRRRKAEESLLSANRKLLELESLKEDLINMVVHDMKNPVSNTVMGLELVEFGCEGSLTREQHEFLLMAKRNQFKLSEMISNLLEISRLESGKIEINKSQFDILRMINSTVERYAAMLEVQGKSVHISIDPAAQWIISAEGMLERVFSNILSNAIRHSYPKGEIMVHVIPSVEDGSVSISVRDFGEGIAKEYHEKIFEKFVQSEPRESDDQTSTGLGLAFCMMAVESLGGSISVESGLGQGSCFTIKLPGALAAVRK